MSRLYVIATPIGNLDDFSPRAVAALMESSLVLCEDTRVSRKLLNHFEVPAATTSYHEHTSMGKLQALVKRIDQGETMALVSDAGTPGVSDPGARFVAELVRVSQGQVRVVPIPGPSAVTALLSVSGFPADAYVFHGFPPHKKGRNTYWKIVADEKRTSVFFESPHRVEKAMEELSALCDPHRKIVIGRELTKMFESVRYGEMKDAPALLRSEPIKGEYVIAVEGR
jgi:16S rRNA (cytidine1402-2'-O)-methyltransferase